VTGHTGDWTYPDERCVRVRMCQRCGEITSKQEHTWSPFEYVTATRCEQERRCDWCGAAESRVQHSWDRGATPASTTRASPPPAVAAARKRRPAPDQSGSHADPAPAAASCWSPS